jgi:hypothetical protein
MEGAAIEPPHAQATCGALTCTLYVCSPPPNIHVEYEKFGHMIGDGVR